MSNRGGIATLNGIKYEIKAVLYEIPKLLRGQVKSLRYQPLSSALKTSTRMPKQISTDDFAILSSNEQSCYCQAKCNTTFSDWTIKRLFAEGVLQQFLQQHRDIPNSLLRFVSNLPTQPLKNLAQYAQQAISPDEFSNNWTNDVKENSKCITENLDINITELWQMLQKIECIHLTEDLVDRYISDYASERYTDTDKFVSVLKKLIEDNPGRLIDCDKVIAVLEEKGLYHLPEHLSKT